MKILLVNKFLYLNGGSETYVIQLGEYLSSQGHEVQYFGMEDKRNLVGNQWEICAPNVEYHGNKQNWMFKINTAVSSIYSKRACEMFGEALNKFQPDIVHLNNINYQLTPAIIYEATKRQIPIVQTVHDVQIACPSHRFYIEHEQKICVACKDGNYFHCVQKKCLHRSRLKSMLAAIESYYYHMRNTYNCIDCYICPSRFIAEQIVDAGVEQRRIKVMHNFSAVEKYTDAKIPDRKYALYFGRLSKEKGIESFVEACKKLPDVDFVLAGKGPLEEYVIQEAKKLHNVEYAGFKTGNALRKLIAEAAYSICPSECYENCPLSVVESQMLGTPVIGSDLGGTKELIQDGKTGIIFRGADIQSMVCAIRKLWDNDDLLKKMSQNCLGIHENTLEIYAKHLTKIYEKCIREKRGSYVK